MNSGALTPFSLTPFSVLIPRSNGARGKIAVEPVTVPLQRDRPPASAGSLELTEATEGDGFGPISREAKSGLALHALRPMDNRFFVAAAA